jgi:hypothetical protein
MAKGAKAACPVCGQEISDPDFEKNRARGGVLKCANCLNMVEWVKPLLDRKHVHTALWVGFAVLALFAGSMRLRNPWIRRLDDNVALVLGVLAGVRILMEKMGFFKPRLQVTDRPYEDPPAETDRLKEQTASVELGPELRLKRRSWVPSFLRRKSALTPNDPARFDRNP